jgi:branched-chain amino acid transport system ATP-binding protein
VVLLSFLKVIGVSKYWGGNKALENITFSMDSNILAIFGPNGAGKTTLLNIIAGIINPTKGEIYYNERNITKLKPWERVRLGISKTFQIVRPFRTLTVEENILLFNKIRENVNPEEVMKITGLFDFRYKYPDQLPFGYLKRLEIAKVLSANPEILLLDEPFGGLNSEEIKELLDVFIKLKTNGKKLIIIEHKISSLLDIAENVIFLDRGKKIFEGSIKKFLEFENIKEYYFGGIGNA